MKCDFSYEHYKYILEKALELEYHIYGCKSYIDARNDNKLSKKNLVMRHDVDTKALRAFHFAEIENRLGIKSTYFIRVFSNEYNIFSYDTMPIIKEIKAMGHEIGYHAEPVDVAVACKIESKSAFIMGKKALEALLEDKIIGVASHREATGHNNLQECLNLCSLEELGIGYEAYDDFSLKLFKNSYYVTDGYEWYWRSFVDGKLTKSKECICKVLDMDKSIVYCLTHPNSWYEKHYHRLF